MAEHPWCRVPHHQHTSRKRRPAARGRPAQQVKHVVIICDYLCPQYCIRCFLCYREVPTQKYEICSKDQINFPLSLSFSLFSATAGSSAITFSKPPCAAQMLPTMIFTTFKPIFQFITVLKIGSGCELVVDIENDAL